MKWNISIVKGKKINRDFESSGERNRKQSLTQDCVFFEIYKCLNSCGKHETKEGNSPVANENFKKFKVIRKLIWMKNGEPSSNF